MIWNTFHHIKMFGKCSHFILIWHIKFHKELIPKFSPLDLLTLRKEVDLHLTPFRNKLSIFFSAAQSSMSCIFIYSRTFVINWSYECKRNTFQPSPRIWGGSNRAVKWWLNSYIPVSSLWLANGKKLVKNIFLCCQASSIYYEHCFNWTS